MLTWVLSHCQKSVLFRLLSSDSQEDVDCCFRTKGYKRAFGLKLRPVKL